MTDHYIMTSPPIAYRRRQHPQRGVSLIVVLIMLVIIGITAATSMRTATSEQRATNNVRLQNSAQQYAEAALRVCEAQMALASTARVGQFAKFQTANLPTTTVVGSVTSVGWSDPATWTGSSGIASASRYTLVAADLSDSDALPPGAMPQCVVELQTMGSPTFQMAVVTARGFSTDYKADGSGNTIQGAVVWLQSIINAN